MPKSRTWSRNGTIVKPREQQSTAGRKAKPNKRRSGYQIISQFHDLLYNTLIKRDIHSTCFTKQYTRRFAGAETHHVATPSQGAAEISRGVYTTCYCLLLNAAGYNVAVWSAASIQRHHCRTRVLVQLHCCLLYLLPVSTERKREKNNSRLKSEVLPERLPAHAVNERKMHPGTAALLILRIIIRGHYVRLSYTIRTYFEV